MTHTVSWAILRGRAGVMFFSTRAVQPSRAHPWRLATIPMIVRMQVLRDVATRSVGEKRSPLPWLSMGASVSRRVPEGPWLAWQRSCPS